MSKTRNKPYDAYGLVADTLLIPDMDKHYTQGYIVVEYFDAAGDNVTPSAGTVTITASENSIVEGSIPDGVIDCTDSDYTRPDFSGVATHIKATPSGIAGAVTYKMIVNRGC